MLEMILEAFGNELEQILEGAIQVVKLVREAFDFRLGVDTSPLRRIE